MLWVRFIPEEEQDTVETYSRLSAVLQHFLVERKSFLNK